MSSRSLRFAVCLCGAALCCAAPPATSKAPAGAPAPTLVPASPPAAAPPAAVPPAREARRALIDQISALLRERYIEPEVAERTIEAIQQHWQNGDYDAADDASLAKLVRADLRAVSHDEHLGLYFGAGGRRPPGGPGGAGPDPAAPGGAGGERRFGFGPSRRLSGNVAVLPLFGFVPANEEAVQEGIGDCLTQVADAAALIIDLRENNGGRVPTFALIISYFLDGPPMLLSRVERRYDHSSYEVWTRADVKGTRFGGKKPLYVLTSARTFSGGEGLAFYLQRLGRAKVIGETTRGGAHPPEMIELGNEFRLGVPVAKAIYSAAHGTWEGVGVIPDVPIAADQALEEAHRRALDELAHSSGESAG